MHLIEITGHRNNSLHCDCLLCITLDYSNEVKRTLHDIV